MCKTGDTITTNANHLIDAVCIDNESTSVLEILNLILSKEKHLVHLVCLLKSPSMVIELEHVTASGLK